METLNPSNHSSSLETDGIGDPGGTNVDEIIDAAIVEAENQGESDKPLEGQLHSNTLDKLPANLYDVSRSSCWLILGLSFYSIRSICRRTKTPLRCSHCNSEADVNDLCACPGCRGRPYHKTCWPKAAFHLPCDGSEIVCKQPTDFIEYVWIKYLLKSQSEPEEQARLHRKDMWSSWFSVPNQQDIPNLYSYSRLQSLITHAQALRDESKAIEQFPSLVSFFGETGGGKSTLIKVLIRNAALNESDEVPIAGNHADRFKSTSGGIHLYCDPKTIDTDVPLFYADCEGLRGSTVSVATHSIEGDIMSASRRHHRHRKLPRDHFELARQGALHDLRDTALRPVLLQWAKTLLTGPDHDKTVVIHPESQQKVVREFYPRLLYTFSDVVCYVTNNPRATENELDHLFQWASIGHDRTFNQRIRPGLLIIINKDAPSPEKRWLDVDYATAELLRNLELSTKFEELKEEWRLRGRTILTAKDLILCYYDSFRIICIPSLTPETTHEIAAQFLKLYNEIKGVSERVRRKRRESHMNLDVRSFCNYVEHVVRRLGRDLRSSVDFHYLAGRNTEHPIRFRDHVTALLVKLKQEEENVDLPCDVQEGELVKRVIPFIACCIASQSHENRTIPARKLEIYMRDCRQRLERFRETSWRCERRIGLARCRNYWAGHEKGHQFSRDQLSSSDRDPSLLVGTFQCTWDPENWSKELFAEIRKQEDQDIGLNFPITAQKSGVRGVRSNRTRFTCLSGCPVYILPCDIQHTICDRCATRFNHTVGRSQATLCLQHCPLGCRFKGGKPWHSRIKPSAAGVRVLSLDGGGVRGILELMILQEVLEKVGFGIPISELFDLAIGTSTGGIIALGLFKMGWTIETAISEFKYLSDEAFSKSDKRGIPVFRHSTQLLYSHRYKGRAIDRALQEVFGQGLLFGANETSHSEKVKVGVLAAVHGSRRPYLFTNYSRNPAWQDDDYLVREDDLADEMKCWEAARSTSAAPTYFPPHYHEAKRQSYVDGALQRNNPIQILEDERRAIWKDNFPPDIMLSIGTGIQVGVDGTARSVGKSQRTAMRLFPMGIRGRIAVGLDVIQNTTDCNRQWNEFVISTKWNQGSHRICHRLNVGLEGRPPKLDDVESIETLKDQARRYLKQRSGPYLDRHYRSAQGHISLVARRLLAALFYFETSVIDEHDRCTGIIHCRLSSAMRDNFCRLLSEGPTFRIRQRDERGSIISNLKPQFDELTFSGPVNFQVRSKRRIIEMILPRWSSWERISGFSGYP